MVCTFLFYNFVVINNVTLPPSTTRNDFSLYKFDPSQLDFEVSEVQLGSSFDLEEQTELILIGNNDGEEYSVKFGRVTNLHINRGDRHSYAFQASFDRTGGSSGSPVLRAKDGEASYQLLILCSLLHFIQINRKSCWHAHARNRFALAF